MICFAFVDQLTARILLLFILAVPVRVKSAQCPDCTGQIKSVDATGKCLSCWPCPKCIDGFTTLSVSCGSTVFYGTRIGCVLVQLKPKASSQTRHLTSSPVTIISSSKFTVVPVTSNSQLVISATSSLISASSSIIQGEGSRSIEDISATQSSLISAGSSIIQDEGSRSTENPNTENILPSSSYSKWEKDMVSYIISAVCLLIISWAIVRKFKRKNNHQSQPSAEICDVSPTSPVHQPLTAQDDEASCHINFATNRSCTRTSEIGDRFLPGTATDLVEGNTNITTASRCEVAEFPGTPSQADKTARDSQAQTDHNTSYTNCILVNGPMIVQQPLNQLLPPGSWPHSLVDVVNSGPINCGAAQQSLRVVNWSALSQKDKYSTKILEMPFQLLNKICESLDIPRADGNDVRMLAYNLGFTTNGFELFKQAAIRQNPGDPVTYAVLKERFYSTKPSGTVGDFVGMMKEIGREDVVRDINDWSELHPVCETK